MYKCFFKSIFDLLSASLFLLLTSPFFLIISICLIISEKGSPFFMQLRPGKNGKIFKIVKFKTMNDQKNIDGELLPDRNRLTRIGKFLRKTSLDELPQFINIIKGDMSLIGPRPLLCEYLKYYNELQNRRHEVKPGITGLAQVNGRNSLSWEERFILDVYYVDNLTFILDIKILLLTIIRTFKKDNIYSAGGETMTKFNGNN